MSILTFQHVVACAYRCILSGRWHHGIAGAHVSHARHLGGSVSDVSELDQVPTRDAVAGRRDGDWDPGTSRALRLGFSLDFAPFQDAKF